MTNEQNELHLYDILSIGDVVGDTNRTVIATTQLTEAVPGDSYARWIAICFNSDSYHQYAVWDVIATPRGFSASGGDYYHSLLDATNQYIKRGGQV